MTEEGHDMILLDECHEYGRDNGPLWWWLAINGNSCAASPLPLPTTLFVSPEPEQLIGFTSQKEQLKKQRFFLEAPIKAIEKYMHGALLRRINDGDVEYIACGTPEPPTDRTLWLPGETNAPAEAVELANWVTAMFGPGR